MTLREWKRVIFAEIARMGGCRLCDVAHNIDVVYGEEIDRKTLRAVLHSLVKERRIVIIEHVVANTYRYTTPAGLQQVLKAGKKLIFLAPA